MNQQKVITVGELDTASLPALLTKYGMDLQLVEQQTSIPGSFWGESEAGLIDQSLYVRSDTPVHSALHETCHYICMDGDRRQGLHTDAGGDYAEENAVCYLQILLADHLPDVGRDRLMQDMDSWGYTFRLGSAQAWFESDAQDACDWLRQHQLIDTADQPTWNLRM